MGDATEALRRALRRLKNGDTNIRGNRLNKPGNYQPTNRITSFGRDNHRERPSWGLMTTSANCSNHPTLRRELVTLHEGISFTMRESHESNSQSMPRSESIDKGLSGENSLLTDCPCSHSQVEARQHILIRRHQFNMLLEEPIPIKKFVNFLKDNPGVFAFFHYTDPPGIGPIVHISQSMSPTLHPPTIRSALWSGTSVIAY